MLGAGGRHRHHREKLGLRLGSSRSRRAKAEVGTSAIFSMFLTDLSRSSIAQGSHVDLMGCLPVVGRRRWQRWGCGPLRWCVGTYLCIWWDFEKFWSVVMTNHNTEIFLGSLSSQPTSTTTLPATTAPGGGHQSNHR